MIPMNDQLILKNRIKEARTERRLSQAESLATFAYLRVLSNAFV